MPIAAIKQKTALYLGKLRRTPERFCRRRSRSSSSSSSSSKRSASNSNLGSPTNKYSQHSHHTLTVYRCYLHAVRFFCRALWEVGFLHFCIDFEGGLVYFDGFIYFNHWRRLQLQLLLYKCFSIVVLCAALCQPREKDSSESCSRVVVLVIRMWVLKSVLHTNSL